MSDELITADNVSNELLKSLFDAAFMDASYDSDGDLLLKEQCHCYVFPDKEHRRIWLLVRFDFKATVGDHEKLICANEINTNYLIVRAGVRGKALQFTYDVSLDGGITKKALVLLVKRFRSIPHDAVADYGKDLIE